MQDWSQTPAPLTEHVLEREGCAIHYWTSGPEDRPLVVFMHGATMDHRMFNAQVEALVPEYRVLVWDARSHGRSQPNGATISLELYARDMRAILDELGVDRAVIGGQSLGGYVAQHVYWQAPERVQAMVIIGSTPIAKAYSKLEVWALKRSMQLFALWPYGHMVKTFARNTARTEPVREYAVHAIRQIDRRSFLTIWEAVTLAVDEKGKPGCTFDVPLLLVHGEYDRTGTIRRDMPLWAKAEPDATYHCIPDASHNANQDNAMHFNRLLLDFLRRRIG